MPFSETLLSRVEDASLNASAPPQQLWLDGWLLRSNPGKAKRARCIHALAPGRLALGERLQQARAVYAAAGLPMLVRITPFSQPPAPGLTLDSELARLGWAALDDTRVWVCTQLPDPALAEAAAPPGLRWQALDADALATAVGALRGSSLAQQAAHAQRLRTQPLPCQGMALLDEAGQVLACGQSTREASFVGLYDVFTAPAARGRGLARLLCERMLSLQASNGATTGYLQVEHDNSAAQAVYRRLGFCEGYRYHYRQAPD